MTSRERVELALNLQEADRIPRSESFWPETITLWRAQGMPDVPVDELIGYDITKAGWVNHEARPGLVEVLDESDEWHTRKDGHGAILRYWKNKSGTPEHVGFTVTSPDAWAAHKAQLLSIPIESRVDLQGALAIQNAAREKNRWFSWGGVECFEMAKDILGHEILCCAMAEEPDWAADVYMTLAELAVRAYDYLEAGGIRYDGGWVYGDIAYKNGPFCSPRMYRELVMPAHRKQIGWFKERGMKVIYHTDGDFRPLIPSFLEVGINCLQPLEAKANVDIRELKPLYGDRAAFMGNIDIMVLGTNDREKIEEEIASKIPMAMKGGGYLYHSDHSIPPSVTWDTYQFVMDLVNRYGRYS